MTREQANSFLNYVRNGGAGSLWEITKALFMTGDFDWKAN